MQGLPFACVCVAVCVLLERGRDSWEHETLSVSRCGVFFVFFPRAALKHVQPGLVHGRHEKAPRLMF